jgi:O-antigen/teichoic acid export membrane protein
VADVISLKKNTIANYVGQFYVVFIGIVILPVYMQYLGSEAFGLIGFFIMLSGWMALLDVGLSSTMARESASLKDSKKGIVKLRGILRTVEFIFVIVAVIISISIYANSDWIVSEWLTIVSLNKSSVSYSIALMGVLIGLRWMTGIYKGVIDGFENQVWLNIYLVIVNTLRFVGGLLVIVYVSQDIEVYFEYQIAIGTIELAVIVMKTYSKFTRSKGVVLPSYKVLTEIAPFALSIAYTSALWVILTQVDKLLLSNILTLVEYGYFTLVVVIINGISIMSSPIGAAIRPRMTSLISQGKEVEMLRLYRKGSQFVAIMAFTVSGVVATFSEELLYVWTGNMEAAKWSAEILSWYALGSGVLMVLAFQYYLQFAYGNLRYHVIGNTYFGIVQIIVMVVAVYEYGAIGAAVSWFSLQLVFLMFWPAYIHGKFAPGLHKKWIMEDILPFIMISFFALFFASNIEINQYDFNRFELGISLAFIGLLVMSCNILYSDEAKKALSKLFGFS